MNRDIANELISDHGIFSYYEEAHKLEHSIEVQLPFLYYIFGENLQIVPIVLGTNQVSETEEIAKALKKYFLKNNLFIISSDFSHYPNYQDAVKIDDETMRSIESNAPDNFIQSLDNHEKSHIPNLSTSACGWTSILSLMNMTREDNSYAYIPIMYRNSGDYLNQNRSRVVGYHSIMVIKSDSEKGKANEEKEPGHDPNNFSISEEGQRKLLELARETIDYYLKKNEYLPVDDDKMQDEISSLNGAFVTLHEKGELRGCIGRFTADEPLYQTVQKMAVSAATEDYRFDKVNIKEMNEIDIEISVLSPLKKIDSIDEIEMGKHGIYLIHGYNRGTFLPQVATETGWSKEEFLGHCARDKARIGWFGWKDADIYIYEAFVFGEKTKK